MLLRSDALTAVLAIVVVVLAGALALAVVYLVRLLRLWRLVRDPAMPTAGKVAFWAALIYAISPIDVLPDPIYLDDAGVLVAAATFVLRTAKRAGLLDRPPRDPARAPSPRAGSGEVIRGEVIRDGRPPPEQR